MFPIEAFNDNSLALAEFSESLTETLKNLYGLFSDLAQIGQSNENIDKNNQENFQDALEISRNLIDNIGNLIETTKSSDKKVKDYEKHIELLKMELEKTENKLLEVKNVEKDASNQSQFTASMGQTMGQMLWKTSKSQETVDTFISTGTLNEFIILSNVTLNSFMESYSDELPSPESHEFNFAMSIIGTNINITAQRSGRNFYLDDKIGIVFVHNMLDHLGEYKMPAGRLLKRMSLILLYNISICRRGAMLIQMSKNGVGNILKCLSEENPNEIQSLALTLINSLLNEIPTKEFCQQVVKNTSRRDIQKLMEVEDSNLKDLCKSFQSKISAIESPDLLLS